MKPICVRCQRFYRPHHTGRRFVEAMPKGGEIRALPGTEHPEQWTPYKVWSGDEWICHGCGNLIIVGVAWQPLSEHYRPDFEGARATAMYLQVNDC